MLSGLWEVKILLASNGSISQRSHKKYLFVGYKASYNGIPLLLYYFNILGGGMVDLSLFSGGHFKHGFLRG